MARIAIARNPKSGSWLNWRLFVRGVLLPEVGFKPGEAQRRLKLASVQEVSQGLAEDTIPLCQRVQLLRIDPQVGQEAGDSHVGSTCCVPHAVRAADAQCHLAGMLGPLRDRGQ